MPKDFDLDAEFERLRATARIAPPPTGDGFPDWTQDGVESLIDFFDNTAHLWDSKFEARYADLHRQVAAQIPTTSDAIRILDVGCGTGLELQHVFKRAPNARITALDQSPRMLAELAAKFEDRASQIQLVSASCLEWPQELGQFDYVISVLCVHHFPPDTKRGVYGDFVSSLETGGLYIEGDQVAPVGSEAELLRLYDAWIARLPGGDRGNGTSTLRCRSSRTVACSQMPDSRELTSLGSKEGTPSRSRPLSRDDRLRLNAVSDPKQT